MRKVKVLLLLMLAGCASMQNTPAQDATWKKLNRCPQMGNTRVNTDGSWQVSGDPASVARVTSCMREQGVKVNSF